MLEELEMLRSRTDEILVQVLSQWSQSVMSNRERQLPPYSDLAGSLTIAHDALVDAIAAVAELDAEYPSYHGHAGEEGPGTTERHFSVDIEEREVTTTATKKGSRK